MTLATLHFLFLAGWGGVLASEFALELLPLRRPELAPSTAVFHYVIDLFVEVPVLLGIVATGVLLLAGRSLEGWLAVKVLCAAVALGANFTCVALVVLRHRGPIERQAARSKAIRLCVVVGVPFGAVALVLGLRSIV